MRATAVLLAAFLLSTAAAAQPALTYQDFTARAHALQPGATHDQIVATLGPATEEDATLMEYDLAGLKGFPGIPGPPNTTTLVELHITMNAGRATAIEFASIPGAAPKPIPEE
ncbi:MAG: hypothetical protein ISS15_19720 [Alphaproteobacteria bacterium]|nr:hypothetical protein [Alphaproteobacteria bacterium]MBL6938082.1 hypothetical protein [Alphaproteobacteria bacterium]MBL7099892.1 hypothetical protein [Alphaproteobacteria bacterium]